MAALNHSMSDVELQRSQPGLSGGDRRVDDLSQLDLLTEESLVSTLKQRFLDGRYYVSLTILFTIHIYYIHYKCFFQLSHNFFTNKTC